MDNYYNSLRALASGLISGVAGNLIYLVLIVLIAAVALLIIQLVSGRRVSV
jgi:hypothetical protein